MQSESSLRRVVVRIDSPVMILANLFSLALFAAVIAFRLFVESDSEPNRLALNVCGTCRLV
ncbi:hypothetical protein CR51_17300 [Caballeronia megalochromosomata]|nr:hypothetical protein CR51_17300 [Caballeronia megalochromosomata]